MEIQINEVFRRYKLHDSEANYKARLDLLTEQLFREYVDLALLNNGYSEKDMVCIRSWYLPIDFDPNKTDIEIFQQWLMELESSLAQLFAKPNPTIWLTFKSQIDALKSVAIDLATHQLDNLWAWQQMGFVSQTNLNVTQAKTDWLGYLCRHPAALKAVLVGLAVEGRLDMLITQKVIGFADTPMLIDELFEFTPNWGTLIDELNSQFDLDWASLVAAVNVSSTKDPRNSQNFTAMPLCLKYYLSLQTDHLATQSDLNRTTKMQVDELKCLVFVAVLSAWNHSGYSQLITNKAGLRDFTFNLVTQISHVAEAASSRVFHPALTSSSQQDNSTSSTLKLAEADNKAVAYSQAHSIPVTYSEDTPLLSDFGGLLFVLNILKQPDWQQRLASLLDKPYPQTHQLKALAQFLITPSILDPVMQVFSGEVAEPDSLQLEPSVFNDSDLEAFALFAEQLKAELFIRLGEPKATTVAQTFDWLCQRKAQIQYQPGWVNVVYEMASVDTQIRGAGLDLNPDYVPWLGFVVKFYYE